MNALAPLPGAAQRAVESAALAPDPHQYASCRALWRAVILLAWWDSFDSTSDTERARNGTEMRCAQAWFRSEDMYDVARLAGLEPLWVLRRWDALQRDFAAAGSPRNFLGRVNGAPGETRRTTSGARRTKGAARAS